MRSTEGITRYRQAVQAQKMAAVVLAAEEEARSGRPMQLSRVARRAGVSRKFIYSHPQLLMLIDTERDTWDASNRSDRDPLVSVLTIALRKYQRNNDGLKRADDNGPAVNAAGERPGLSSCAECVRLRKIVAALTTELQNARTAQVKVDTSLDKWLG